MIKIPLNFQNIHSITNMKIYILISIIHIVENTYMPTFTSQIQLNNVFMHAHFVVIYHLLIYSRFDYSYYESSVYMVQCKLCIHNSFIE